MHVGILGAGHAGVALAVLLIEQGEHDVRLYSAPDHTERLAQIDASGGKVRFTNTPHNKQGEVSLTAEQRSDSLKSLVDFSDVIYNTTPIQAHDHLFRLVLAYIQHTKRRLTYVNLGGGFSIFSHQLDCAQSSEDINVATLHTLPYACRLSGAELNILNFRESTTIAFSQDIDGRQVELLQSISGKKIEIDPDILHMSLDRSSYVMHPAITLFNMTKIDRGEDFTFYSHGLTASTKDIIIGANEERHTLARRLGYHDYPSPTERLERFVKAYGADFSGIRPPTSARHRYIIEDLPFGLVPIIDLGRVSGVEMPVCSSLVNIASTVSGLDLWDSPYRLLKNERLLSAFLRSAPPQ